MIATKNIWTKRAIKNHLEWLKTIDSKNPNNLKAVIKFWKEQYKKAKQ